MITQIHIHHHQVTVNRTFLIFHPTSVKLKVKVKMEQIIPPLPKRIKTTRKNQKPKLDSFDQKEACQCTDVSTTLCNPLEHDTIHQHTSGNNHSLPSPLYMVQESACNVTETDTPSKSNHAEANILPTEVDDHPVPEAVTYIGLGHWSFTSRLVSKWK